MVQPSVQALFAVFCSYFEEKLSRQSISPRAVGCSYVSEDLLGVKDRDPIMINHRLYEEDDVLTMQQQEKLHP